MAAREYEAENRIECVSCGHMQRLSPEQTTFDDYEGEPVGATDEEVRRAVEAVEEAYDL